MENFKRVFAATDSPVTHSGRQAGREGYFSRVGVYSLWEKGTKGGRARTVRAHFIKSHQFISFP